MSMCMLLSRDCARRGSPYSTIPYGAVRRGDRFDLGALALVADPDDEHMTRDVLNQQSPTYATKFTPHTSPPPGLHALFLHIRVEKSSFRHPLTDPLLACWSSSCCWLLLR